MACNWKTTSAVRSHIGSERPEPGPYKCMLTLTSKTHFGVMRGCQEQPCEGDLGGSLGFGWTGRPKVDNILLVRWGVTSVFCAINSLFSNILWICKIWLVEQNISSHLSCFTQKSRFFTLICLLHPFVACYLRDVVWWFFVIDLIRWESPPSI